MLDQGFNEKNFRKLLIPADFANFSLPNDQKIVKRRLDAISKEFADGKINYDLWKKQHYINVIIWERV